MVDIPYYKSIFEKHGGMMRTKNLNFGKVYYHNIQQLIEAGYIEKVRYGYYQWIDPEDSGKSRFNIDYPFVKPYYVEPKVLELGQTTGSIDVHQVRIYDKDRKRFDRSVAVMADWLNNQIVTARRFSAKLWNRSSTLPLSQLRMSTDRSAGRGVIATDRHLQS